MTSLNRITYIGMLIQVYTPPVLSLYMDLVSQVFYFVGLAFLTYSKYLHMIDKMTN